VWLARDRTAIGVLALADELHPETPAAMEELRKLGVTVRLLSGDRRPAVIQLAKKLKLKAYEAELTPEQKLERVRDLVAAGVTTVMVGDGINDAPALAAASAGIALGTGADVAREAADICLVGHSPRLIPEAIRVARVSARIMRQSLLWAAGYNIVMLPVAMLAPLPPWLATAAMMGSSLSVVANALRLRRLI
jgi:P-type E1-E2 ATPase